MRVRTKILMMILTGLLFTYPALAAKVSTYTPISTLNNQDRFLVTVDPLGSAVTSGINWGDLQAILPSGGGWTDGGTSVYLTTATDKVGLGTSSPAQQLELTGNLKLPATTSTTGIVYVGDYTFLHNYGSNNTSVYLGQNTGNLTNTGSNNVGVGPDILPAVTNGGDNVAIGRNPGYSLTTGDDNVLIGRDVGYSLTTGGNNVFIGDGAGYSTVGTDDNVFIGENAGNEHITGSSNLFLGPFAGSLTTSGTNNIWIGNNAGALSSNGLSSSVCLGSNCSATADNVLILGNGSMNIGIGTTAPVKSFEVTGGDIYVNTTPAKIYLREPDGTCCYLSASNTETLSCTSVACP